MITYWGSVPPHFLKRWTTRRFPAFCGVQRLHLPHPRLERGRVGRQVADRTPKPKRCLVPRDLSSFSLGFSAATLGTYRHMLRWKTNMAHIHTPDVALGFSAATLITDTFWNKKNCGAQPFYKTKCAKVPKWAGRYPGQRRGVQRSSQGSAQNLLLPVRPPPPPGRGWYCHQCSHSWSPGAIFFFKTCCHIIWCQKEPLCNTSSHAQGGGRSFTDRKPIGEVGVVMHGWQSKSTDGSTDRWSIGLSICPSN